MTSFETLSWSLDDDGVGTLTLDRPDALNSFTVTMARELDAIAMRVHADQKWRLAVDGDPRAVDLAQWGNRAIALSARAGACLTGPTGYGAR